MKKHIPNSITLLNLFSGCIAVVMALQGHLVVSAWLIGLAALFDFLDGMAARLLKVKSPIGKELDSLADVVSFGLVPGAILYMLIGNNIKEYFSDEMVLVVAPFAGFIITFFSALRLAKFNTDQRQEDAFYGLPTPANAMLIGSFPLILQQQDTLAGLHTGFIHVALVNPFVLILMVVLLSWLLVADIRLLSLKFKSTSWHENQARYLLIILAFLWLLLFQFAGIPMIIFSYLVISVMMKV